MPAGGRVIGLVGEPRDDRSRCAAASLSGGVCCDDGFCVFALVGSGLGATLCFDDGGSRRVGAFSVLLQFCARFVGAARWQADRFAEHVGLGGDVAAAQLVWDVG